MSPKLKNTKIDRNWSSNFKNLIERVKQELLKQEYINSITLSKLEIWPANSCGYYNKLFKIKNISGGLYLWIDNYANHSHPKISISYHNENIKPILKIAKHLQNFDSTLKINLAAISNAKTNEFILQKPLALGNFNKFIIENYEGVNYLTVILADKLNVSLNSKTLVKNIIKFINRLTRVCLKIKNEPKPNASVKENDKILNIHTRRERKLKHREDRKIKDDYTCKVCKYNQKRKLGPLGAAALEVHHLTPLSKSETPVHTNINDLVTVCANCHKMIHKLGGSKQAYNLLKNKYKVK